MVIKKYSKFVRKMRNLIPFSCNVIISFLTFMFGIFLVYSWFIFIPPAKVTAIVGKCVYYTVKIDNKEQVILVNCGKGFRISGTKVTKI